MKTIYIYIHRYLTTLKLLLNKYKRKLRNLNLVFQQVIAILCLLIQSLAKTKPSDIKRHIKAKLKDPLFVGKVNLFLFEHGFGKL